MKKTVLFLFFALGIISTIYANSKNNTLEIYVNEAKKIVKNYNSDEFDKIWDNCDLNLQKKRDLTQFKVYYTAIKSFWGKITGINTHPTISSEVYIFKVKFSKKSYYLFLSLDDNGKYKTFFFSDHLPISITYPEVTPQTTIKELADAYLKEKVNAGLAIGTINNGKELTHFYGVVKKGTTIKPNSNTIFEIGSITKTFTGIALLEMQEQGLLNVNDTINKFLPKNVKTPTFEGKQITLKNLAAQTSGLPRVIPNLAKTMKNWDNPYENYTVKDLYDFLNSYTLKRPIGSKFEYSNIGFGLLGHILVLKADKSYGNVIKNEICDKLNMTNTGVILSSKQEKHLAQGYLESGEPTNTWNFGCLEGNGALKSTVSDMLKYLKANLNPGNSVLGRAIKKSHLPIFYPKSTDYIQAYGWEIGKLADRKVIYKDGLTGGYFSYIGFFEGTKTGVVILSNSAVSVDELAKKILEKLAMDLP